MNNDRELLELAANAAGLSGYIHEWINGPEFIIPGENPVTWNPIADDGDALRLAVKLRFVIHVWDDDEAVSVAKTLPNGEDPNPINHNEWFFETSCGCGGIESATRRAIVRAAAETQRAKEAA